MRAAIINKINKLRDKGRISSFDQPALRIRPDQIETNINKINREKERETPKNVIIIDLA